MRTSRLCRIIVKPTEFLSLPFSKLRRSCLLTRAGGYGAGQADWAVKEQNMDHNSNQRTPVPLDYFFLSAKRSAKKCTPACVSEKHRSMPLTAESCSLLFLMAVFKNKLLITALCKMIDSKYIPSKTRNSIEYISILKERLHYLGIV